MIEELRIVFELLGMALAALVTGYVTYRASQKHARHEIETRTDHVRAELIASLEKKLQELRVLLDAETARRVTAETRLSELEAQRERDLQMNAREMAALHAMTMQQDKDIQALRDKVSMLEAERDALRQQRDAAQASQQTLAARLETATERLSKAEAQIAALSVENKAFELLFSRLRIVVDNRTEQVDGGQNVQIG